MSLHSPPHPRWQPQALHGNASHPSPTRPLLLSAGSSYFAPAPAPPLGAPQFSVLHGGAINVAYLPSLALIAPGGTMATTASAAANSLLGVTGAGGSGGISSATSPYLSPPYAATSLSATGGGGAGGGARGGFLHGTYPNTTSPQQLPTAHNHNSYAPPPKKLLRPARGTKGGGGGGGGGAVRRGASAALTSGMLPSGANRNILPSYIGDPNTAARRHALNPPIGAVPAASSSSFGASSLGSLPASLVAQAGFGSSGRMFQRFPHPAAAANNGSPGRPFVGRGTAESGPPGELRRAATLEGHAAGGGARGNNRAAVAASATGARSLSTSPQPVLPAGQKQSSASAASSRPPHSNTVAPLAAAVSVADTPDTTSHHTSSSSSAGAAAAPGSPTASIVAPSLPSSPVPVVINNALPDLLFLLAPAEHAQLMQLLKARIDGRPAGALTVSDSQASLRIDAGGNTLGVNHTTGSLRRPSFTAAAAGSGGEGSSGSGGNGTPVGTPPSPSRVAHFSSAEGNGTGGEKDSLMVPIVPGSGGGGGSGSPPQEGSPPNGPVGAGVGGISAALRGRSKSFSSRASLPRRPSLMSVREEGAGGGAGAHSFGGMSLPMPVRSLPLRNEEEEKREAMLRAIAGTNADLVVGSSDDQQERQSPPPTIQFAEGLPQRRTSIPTIAPSAASAATAAAASSPLGSDRPRASSLFVRPLGGGGLIALPPNWSRQGSTTASSVAGDDAPDSDEEGEGAAAQRTSSGPGIVPLVLPPTAMGSASTGSETANQPRKEASELSIALSAAAMPQSAAPAALDVSTPPLGSVGAGAGALTAPAAHVARAHSALNHSSSSGLDPYASSAGVIFSPPAAGNASTAHSLTVPRKAAPRNRYTMGSNYLSAIAAQLSPVAAGAAGGGSVAASVPAPPPAPAEPAPFDAELEENGGQYWSLSHASLLLERIALERALPTQFAGYLSQALESISTARAIAAQRMTRRVVLEEKLKSHPEQVADWLAEFAGGGDGHEGGGGPGSSSHGNTSRASSISISMTSRAATGAGHTPLTSPKREAQIGPSLPSSPSSRVGSTVPASAAAMAVATNASGSNSGPSSGSITGRAGSGGVPTSSAVASQSAFGAANAEADAAAAAAAQAQKDADEAEAAAAADSSLVPYSSLDDKLVSDPLQSLLQKSQDWDFELFDFHSLSGGHSLLFLSVHLLRECGLRDTFPHLDEGKFFSFFRDIERGYNNEIPYHTSAHGADVLQGMVYFMSTPLLRATLTPLDVLAGLVAAGCHDYEHQGRNNAFMVATAHPLALLYNDTSVMESHHAAASWAVLLRPENDFLASFPPSERAEFRASFLSAILHTDMSMHMKGVLEFEGSVKAKRAHGAWFSTGSKDDRRMLLDMACHVSDLGNPAKPFPLAREWTRRVVEEFFSQGDAELEAGLKVSPMMDREKAAVDAQQFGFIDFVVGPLFNSWGDALEPANIAPCLEHLSANKAYYKARIAPPPAAAASTAAAAAPATPAAATTAAAAPAPVTPKQTPAASSSTAALTTPTSSPALSVGAVTDPVSPEAPSTRSPLSAARQAAAV